MNEVSRASITDNHFSSVYFNKTDNKIYTECWLVQNKLLKMSLMATLGVDREL